MENKRGRSHRMGILSNYGVSIAYRNGISTIIFKQNTVKAYKPSTLPELRRVQEIKINEIAKVISRQTYYSWIKGETTPKNKETIRKFCELFKIDEKTFKKLLQNTLNSNK